jgi:hypothetical protein
MEIPLTLDWRDRLQNRFEKSKSCGASCSDPIGTAPEDNLDSGFAR